jgi:hypothetical protein
MTRLLRSRFVLLAFAAPASFIAATFTARPAAAAEFQLKTGILGETSTWRADPAMTGALQLGLRFGDLASVYMQGRVGYAGVDQRMLTMVQIGGQIWGRLGKARPYFRFGLVHQHEESWAAVDGDVFGAMFGVGDGIRHRGGFEWAGGVDVPLAQVKRTQFFASGEGLVTWFPDPRGPAAYSGLLLSLGLNYGI